MFLAVTRLVRQTNSPALIALARVLIGALSLLSALLVARGIGPNGRGETAAAIAAFSICPILLGFGLPVEVRRLCVTQEPARIIRSAALISASLFFPSAAIAYLLSATIFSDLFGLSRALTITGITLSPLSVLWMSINSALVATQRYRAIFALQICYPLVYILILIILFLAEKMSTGTVLAANLGGVIATFFMSYALLPFPLLGERYAISTLLKGSARFGGSSFAEAAGARLDQLIALPLLGSYQAGLYSVAAAFGTLPLSLGQAIAAPYFSKAVRAATNPELGIREQAIRSAFSLILPTCLLLAMASPFLIPLIFGDSFQESIGVALLVIFGSIGLSTSYVCSALLAATGNGLALTTSQTISLSLGVLSLTILGPTLGAIGGGLSFVMAQAILLFLLLKQLSLLNSKIIPKPVDLRSALRTLFHRQ